MDLAWTVPLSDALVCRRQWNSPAVLQERNIVLGPDPKDFINQWRITAVKEVLASFQIIKEAEKAAYGPKSYFNLLESQPSALSWIPLKPLNGRLSLPAKTTIEWPLIPDLNNPLISNEAMETTLAELALLSKIYVHPRVLAFPTGAGKTNWVKSVKDAEKWDVFSAWFQALKGDTFVAIGCFSTWSTTWVGYKDDWTKLEWHTWGAALINPESGKGKALVIYDCDPKLGVRRQKEVMGTQTKLIEAARKYDINTIYYNQDVTNTGQEKCLLYTFVRIFTGPIEYTGSDTT